ncbi:histidine kinase [uncultured Bacteroides sp.]|uniref:histidine kinase n=1 Tax=uncultured Bacteroides sp. TaxID=162156 RepID=UPI002AAA7164|nr:histidine kinase [uncultured Bacteroides sp.]
MNISLQRIKNIFFICILWLTIGSCHTRSSETIVDQYSFVDSLIDYYKNISVQHPDIAKHKLLEIRQIADDSIQYYKLTQFISYADFNNNQIDSAFLLNNKVIQFCNKNPHNITRLAELKTYAYFHRSNFFQIKGKLDSAIFYLKQAHFTVYHTKGHKELANIYIYLAYDYSLLGNYTMANFFYKKAKSTADTQHLNKEVYSSIYTGLAKVYLGLNNLKMTDYYLNQAEKNYKSMSPYKQYVFASIKGNYYYTIKDYRKALGWYIKANAITNSFKLNTYKGIAKCNMGEIYLLLNQTDSAKYYLDKANVCLSKGSFDENKSFYINCLYAELALQKNDLRKAQILLFKNYDLSKINNQNIYLYNKRLESYYERINDFHNAYLYRRRADIQNDSLFKKTISNAILEIDTRYSQDTSLLKHDIIISESKSEVQKMGFISIFSLLLFIISITIFIYYTRKKRNLKRVKLITTITRLRMENVRNRICPHVLYNMLNAVMPVVKQDDNRIHLFRLIIQSLRSNLVASEKIAVALEEEIEFVKNYIEFRKKTNNTPIEVNWCISPDVTLETQIISMVIQIPVENSIKYAFEEEQKDAHIDINISTDKQFLYITIEDNGAGYNPGNHTGDKNSTGFGLKVIFQTIELLNQTKNQEKMYFNIENLKNLSSDLHGTKAMIIIPLKYNFEL